MGLESPSELIRDRDDEGTTTYGSLSADAVIADSGAYSFGMAYCDVPGIQGRSAMSTERGWLMGSWCIYGHRVHL